MESLKGKLTEKEAKGLLKAKNDFQILANGRINQIIEIWKEKGYIKQNPVEKAEEAINYIKSHESSIAYATSHFAQPISDLIDGFNYLKKQLESNNE